MANEQLDLRSLQEDLKDIKFDGTDPIEKALARLERLPLSQVLATRGQIPITECSDPLVEVDTKILRVQPHPYQTCGAPYGKVSPFFLRDDVRTRLLAAQDELSIQFPKARLIIYDGYRPLEVQEYMVNYTMKELAEKDHVDISKASAEVRQHYLNVTLKVWALPNFDPKCPPPHSTGAAVDVLIIDGSGKPFDFGAEFDEPSDRILPNYYKDKSDPASTQFHRNRDILNNVMSKQGFVRLSGEYWHFSYGDQYWGLVQQLVYPDQKITALYGRADLAV